MKELDEKGFVFLDANYRPYKCAMWGDQPWLFYWNEGQKCWTSLRRVTQMDIWTFPRNLPEAQQQLYHDAHDKTIARLTEGFSNG